MPLDIPFDVYVCFRVHFNIQTDLTMKVYNPRVHTNPLVFTHTALLYLRPKNMLFCCVIWCIAVLNHIKANKLLEFEPDINPKTF